VQTNAHMPSPIIIGVKLTSSLVQGELAPQ